MGCPLGFPISLCHNQSIFRLHLCRMFFLAAQRSLGASFFGLTKYKAPFHACMLISHVEPVFRIMRCHNDKEQKWVCALLLASIGYNRQLGSNASESEVKCKMTWSQSIHLLLQWLSSCNHIIPRLFLWTEATVDVMATSFNLLSLFPISISSKFVIWMLLSLISLSCDLMRFLMDWRIDYVNLSSSTDFFLSDSRALFKSSLVLYINSSKGEFSKGISTSLASSSMKPFSMMATRSASKLTGVMFSSSSSSLSFTVSCGNSCCFCCSCGSCGIVLMSFDGIFFFFFLC